MDFIAILLILIITIFALHYKFKVLWPFSGKKVLPPGSLGIPLLGESISFLRSMKQDKTDEWMRVRIDKFGPVFKTSIFGAKTVVLTGQAGNRFVFSGGDIGLSYKQPKSIARVLGKYSLFEISGFRYKIFRDAIFGFVKPESIHRSVSKMDCLVQQQLFKELDGKNSVKIVTLMKKIAFNVTCSMFFGIPDGVGKDVLLEEFTTLVKGAWSVPIEIPGTQFHRAMRARKRLCKRFSEVMELWRLQLEEGTVDHKENIITSFLSLRGENGEPVSEEEIIDMILALIMASYDTVTILMTHLVRYLSRDAEVYSKVIEEQTEIMKMKNNVDEELTWIDIQNMKYTWRVAQEAMRLYPPLFGNFRQITRDISVDGFEIPKGWQIMWVASGTQMDRNIFQDPEKFDPSRFEPLSKTYPPYTYIPFAAGPRMCPGAEYSRIESMLVIHHLVTKYEWTEMVPDELVTRDPLPYPVHGLPVKIWPRK